jgi:hypothetical protein
LQKKSLFVVKSLARMDLPFTDSEGSGITSSVRVTPYGRFRQKLSDLLLHKRGSKAALASYCKHPASWVSNLLAPRSDDPRPSLDDLDNIAAFFSISVGELLGAAKPGELTGDEQRMVHAFRVLAEPVQIHFLALIEAASIGNRIPAGRKGLQVTSRIGQTAPSDLRGGADERRAQLSRDERETLQQDIARASHALAEAAARLDRTRVPDPKRASGRS